jgi:hypothetical protein
MHQSPDSDAVESSRAYPAPPSLHWATLLFFLVSVEALVILLVPGQYRNLAIFAVAAAWPTYLCFWIRKLDPRASSLYWAIASVTGFGFIFSLLLWVVVIFELREELLDHYNRRQPVGLRLNWFLTTLFSFVYFQYALNKISKEQESAQEAAPKAVAVETNHSVPA